MITTSILGALALAAAGATQDPLPPQAPEKPQEPQIPADTEIVTTESGLKYSVLAEGDGTESPHIGDVVRVHYTGWLEDGTVFDSSRQRGVPAEFGLGAVIEGWNEALQLMSPGSRLKLTIPPDLAYGEDGSPPVIPANATLIFDVELISVPVRNPMTFMAWGGEEGATTEKGIVWKELVPGDGGPLMDSEMVWLEFAMWTEAGELLFSDLLFGRPLLVPDPAQPQLSLLTELMPLVQSGSHIIARVPVEQVPELENEKLEGESHALWQFQFTAASDFAKPEFVLPPDEELTTTESGLKYKVLRPGCARGPELSNRVQAHYAGWLTDGTGFDNSYDKGQPMTIPLTNLIQGWQEGMQLMGRGSKFLFVVPPDLGYGAQDKGTIPPNSTLVFVVELIDFG